MKLKDIRVQNNMTLEDVSKITNIGTSTLQRYETLQRFPNKNSLKAIQKLFSLNDIDVAEIFLDFYKGE